jgi:glycosyltransferase 2 family protein
MRSPASRPQAPAPARGAPVPRPSGHRQRSPAGPLAAPGIRLGLGLAVTLATALLARRDDVAPCEAEAFRAVNLLSDSLYPAAWMVMQLGALGAAPATAAVAGLAHDRALARRLLADGTATWALSKLVKRLVRRPRPATLIPDARCRGRQAAGLGYLSGHAGVAAAMAAAAFPRLDRTGRAVVLGVAPVVGLTRVYVGAHLPLDILGGAALGLTVDAALALVIQRMAGQPSRPVHDGSGSARGRSPEVGQVLPEKPYSVGGDEQPRHTAGIAE